MVRINKHKLEIYVISDKATGGVTTPPHAHCVTNI